MSSRESSISDGNLSENEFELSSPPPDGHVQDASSDGSAVSLSEIPTGGQDDYSAYVTSDLDLSDIVDDSDDDGSIVLRHSRPSSHWRSRSVLASPSPLESSSVSPDRRHSMYVDSGNEPDGDYGTSFYSESALSGNDDPADALLRKLSDSKLFKLPAVQQAEASSIKHQQDLLGVLQRPLDLSSDEASLAPDLFDLGDLADEFDGTSDEFGLRAADVLTSEPQVSNQELVNSGGVDNKDDARPLQRSNSSNIEQILHDITEIESAETQFSGFNASPEIIDDEERPFSDAEHKSESISSASIEQTQTPFDLLRKEDDVHNPEPLDDSLLSHNINAASPESTNAELKGLKVPEEEGTSQTFTGVQTAKQANASIHLHNRSSSSSSRNVVDKSSPRLVKEEPGAETGAEPTLVGLDETVPVAELLSTFGRTRKRRPPPPQRTPSNLELSLNDCPPMVGAGIADSALKSKDLSVDGLSVNTPFVDVGVKALNKRQHGDIISQRRRRHPSPRSQSSQHHSESPVEQPPDVAGFDSIGFNGLQHNVGRLAQATAAATVAATDGPDHAASSHSSYASINKPNALLRSSARPIATETAMSEGSSVAEASAATVVSSRRRGRRQHRDRSQRSSSPRAKTLFHDALVEALLSRTGNVHLHSGSGVESVEGASKQSPKQQQQQRKSEVSAKARWQRLRRKWRRRQRQRQRIIRELVAIECSTEVDERDVQRMQQNLEALRAWNRKKAGAARRERRTSRRRAELERSKTTAFALQRWTETRTGQLLFEGRTERSLHSELDELLSMPSSDDANGLVRVRAQRVAILSMEVERMVRVRLQRATKERELSRRRMSMRRANVVWHARQWNESYRSLNPPPASRCPYVPKLGAAFDSTLPDASTEAAAPPSPTGIVIHPRLWGENVKSIRPASMSPQRRRRRKPSGRTLRHSCSVEGLERRDRRRDEVLRRRLLEARFEETFRPSLPRSSLRTERAPAGKTVWTRLYEEARRWRRHKEILHRSRQRQLLSDELRMCTFQPQVVSKRWSSCNTPEGRSGRNGRDVVERLYEYDTAKRAQMMREMHNRREQRLHELCEGTTPNSKRRRGPGDSRNVVERLYDKHRITEATLDQMRGKMLLELEENCSFSPRIGSRSRSLSPGTKGAFRNRNESSMERAQNRMKREYLQELAATHTFAPRLGKHSCQLSRNRKQLFNEESENEKSMMECDEIFSFSPNISKRSRRLARDASPSSFREPKWRPESDSGNSIKQSAQNRTMMEYLQEIDETFTFRPKISPRSHELSQDIPLSFHERNLKLQRHKQEADDAVQQRRLDEFDISVEKDIVGRIPLIPKVETNLSSSQ